MTPCCLHWVKQEKEDAFHQEEGVNGFSLENVDSEMPKYFGILQWRRPIDDRGLRGKDMETRSQHLRAEALGTGEAGVLRLRPVSKHSIHELNPRQCHHLDKSRGGGGKPQKKLSRDRRKREPGGRVSQEPGERCFGKGVINTILQQKANKIKKYQGTHLTCS